MGISFINLISKEFVMKSKNVSRVKVSLTALPRYNYKKDAKGADVVANGKKVVTSFKACTANVFLPISIPDVEDALCVIPVDLMRFPKDGVLMPARAMLGQPTYKSKKSKTGERRVSYFSCHLNGAAAQWVEGLITTDWLKAEGKKALRPADQDAVARDYEFADGTLKFVEERKLKADEVQDPDMAEFSEVADALAAKAAAAASESSAPSAAVEDQNQAADQSFNG